MKKGFAVLLSILMVALMGITAMAAPNNFVSSPSSNNNLEIIDWESSEEDKEELIVTLFANRHILNDVARMQLEEARDIIVNTPDLANLNEDLKEKVDSLGIDSKDVAISDLFDVDYSDCDVHDEHGEYKVLLKSDELDKFVGLLHFDGQNWTMIDNAQIDENGYLVYSTDKTGSFAIVLNTYEDESSSGNGPQTGDEFRWWIYVVLMAVSAVAFIVVAIKLKKTEDK